MIHSSRSASRAAALRAGCWLVLLGLAGAGPAFAQGAVSGRVIDAATSAPIAGVTVRALDESSAVRGTAESDSAGYFSVALPSGRFSFEAEHIGYQILSTPSVQLRRGDVLTVEIRVGVSPVAIEPLVVQSRQRSAAFGAEAFHRRREQSGRAGQGRFITREDLERTAVVNVNDLLQRDPALSIRPSRSGNVVVMRSRGTTCNPYLYLNGVQLGMRGETDIAAMLAVTDLEGVEIYPNETSVPAEMWRPGCGSIGFWTRSGERGSPFTWRRIGFAAGWVGIVLLVRAM